MNERDPQDQAVESSTYHDIEVKQQREDGLLSRAEADVNDILAAKEVASPVNFSTSEQECPAWSSHGQAGGVPISQLFLRCLWDDVPLLRQWITQFLAKRQPDALVIAAGMAKQGVTRIALNKQQAIEGFLVIGSAEQDLHGSIAEQVAEHLVAEGQISGYAVYTISVMLC